MSTDPHRRLSGRRILLVEDECLIAMHIQDILEGWGCTVLGPAASTDAALAVIGGALPDAAVLDVNLDGETSEPVANALRRADRPFLVLSAYHQDHLTGALKGATLINKPVDKARLGRELSALLNADGS